MIPPDPHLVPGFLLLEEISFGVDDGVEHAEGLLRADGHAAVAAVQLILTVVLLEGMCEQDGIWNMVGN